MTTPQLITFIVSTIVGIFGILSGFEAYRNRKQKKYEESFKLYFDNFITPMDKRLIAVEEKSNNYEKDIAFLKENINNINDNIDTLNEKSNNQFCQILENEISRLQTAIVSFANDLKKGYTLDENSYQYICKMYDKYKKLGGNSFIDKEFNYIQKKYDLLNTKEN